MSTPNQPPNPKVPPLPGSNPPRIPDPLPPDASPATLLEALLKQPGRLIVTLQRASSLRPSLLLAAVALISLAAYGLVVGSFSGGSQWLAAPLKISLGVFASAVICLPSLFIFSCLAGADVTVRGVVGTLAAALALTALMLIGLVPVGWVFSASSDSVTFMGTMHLLFWLIAVAFGFRLVRLSLESLGITRQIHLKVWLFIFTLVSLQMSTALRPIIGTSPQWFPKEKKFFVTYWIENLGGSDDAPQAKK